MDSDNRINIRVYKRLTAGTILIWNVNLLSPEQRQNIQVRIKKLTDSQWLAPQVCPSTDLGITMADGFTDAVVILHDEDLTEDTPFIAKILFGTNDIREAAVKIAGRNSHMPFIKPIRSDNGTYALPVHLVNGGELTEGILAGVKKLLDEGKKQGA